MLIFQSKCCSFFVRDSQPARLAEKARPRCVPGICSLHFRKLQEILKDFLKKFMQKGWKCLIENRFWNFEIFQKIRKFRKKSRKIDFSIFSIFRFFDFFDFSIFRFFKISFFSFSIFDQKISIFFMIFLKNPFKIFWSFRKWRPHVPRTKRGRATSYLKCPWQFLSKPVISCHNLQRPWQVSANLPLNP